MIDISELRRETPGSEDVLHLDHAGASLLPRPVFDAVRDHLELEARWGGYRAEHSVADRVEAVYSDIATLIGATAEEVALVDSATRAWQLAFQAVPLKPGDRILCSRTEYASNHLAFLQARERFGVEIVPVPPDADGVLDLGLFAAELDRGAALVALTHVPTNGGLVQPAGAVGELCRKADVPLLLDACQSAGQVDLRDIPWDMLSATGRKYLRGPRGTGFLGVRRAWLDRLQPPLMDLHGATWTGPDSYEVRPDARRFELWERSIADILGLGVAVRYALDVGIDEQEARIASTAARLREKLAALPGVEVHDRGRVRCGIVTFTAEGHKPTAIRAALRERDVHVTVSRRKSTLLDMDDRGLIELVRASVHALTTYEELDDFISHLRAIGVR